MNELIAFNIEVIDVNAQTFFGNTILRLRLQEKRSHPVTSGCTRDKSWLKN